MRPSVREWMKPTKGRRVLMRDGEEAARYVEWYVADRDTRIGRGRKKQE
ncbi:hypothetical protein LX15_000796 [Streptoalloteichus tenebrarius]|uniref:Uncharacterized protein n=1 Tax=Streptoalloteichus tenebrarius (strain ATCC 17920 / DSM 40477 / JCM 4838 / CBS 697.72 / NBRC 16177 / NCIMB 11028 / NRRL B-12390 / A12253. 1 / ISP 5477) TaxID=1933 RepID=A0ABT1HNM6_STRSD|nr:hypothetical protein [Streptoalloteichus tenebrarius]MCP2257111.1 hypothetical protein [Streptoalloteichus tenebrarius]BFE98743.1 hypothetical protein GCM10020241_04190 [Streptoalloteichus tenebrarius]